MTLTSQDIKITLSILAERLTYVTLLRDDCQRYVVYD